MSKRKTLEEIADEEAKIQILEKAKFKPSDKGLAPWAGKVTDKGLPDMMWHGCRKVAQYTSPPTLPMKYMGMFLGRGNTCYEVYERNGKLYISGEDAEYANVWYRAASLEEAKQIAQLMYEVYRVLTLKKEKKWDSRYKAEDGVFEILEGECTTDIEGLHEITLRLNNRLTNDPCTICGSPCDPCGLDFFYGETNKLVCRNCTLNYNYRLIDQQELGLVTAKQKGYYDEKRWWEVLGKHQQPQPDKTAQPGPYPENLSHIRAKQWEREITSLRNKLNDILSKYENYRGGEYKPSGDELLQSYWNLFRNLNQSKLSEEDKHLQMLFDAYYLGYINSKYASKGIKGRPTEFGN